METTKPIKTKGRTKVGKVVKKYIIKDMFLPSYNLWLEERQKIMDENGKDHTDIFIDKKGEPILPGTVRGWVSEIEEILGVPFYPHCLRHYTTTYLAKSGLSYTLISELFSWGSEAMCKIYDDTEAKDKKWDELDNLQNKLNGL